MSGALALRDDQQDWTEAQKAALVQLGVGDAPRGDQLVFLHVSQRMRLDPFNKEIYMIGRWDPELGRKKWTIQVAIDGFRSKSEEHPQFGGVKPAEWCGPDGVWTDVWLSDEPPKAARFTVLRRDQDEPIRCVALYREYVQMKSDGKTPTKRWFTAPAHQLGKCAEALTRRTAFPRQLGGVYIPEETEHLDNPIPPAQGLVIDAEPEQAAEPDWDAELAQRRGDPVKVKELLDLARGIRRNDAALLNTIAQAWQEAKAAAPPAAEPPAAAAAKPPKSRMNRLFGLLSDAGLTSTEKRHRLATHMLDKDVNSFADLSAAEVDDLIKRLEQLKTEGKLPPPAAAETPTDDTPAEQPEQQPAEPEGDPQ